MLLHTLRAQYEAITGEPEVVIRKQQQFREIWKKAEVFTSFGERIKWRYAPPRWLFMPPSWNNPTQGLLILDMLVDVDMRVILYCMNSL